MSETKLPEAKKRRGPSAPPPEKPRKKHTVRNVLLLLLLLLVATTVFVFGVNKWRIDIAITGDSSVTCECGFPYRDQGASAEVTGSILSFVHHPVEVETSTASVNIHEPGTYYVHYRAKYLWLSAAASRTVNIVDTTPPVIELKHIDDYYTLPHHAYEEEGFTATDNHDGDVTALVESEERDGVVYYSVTDLAGNTATAEREIFYDDRNAPVFHFSNGEEAFLYVGGKWKNDASAEDDADGDVSDRIEVSGTVDTKKVGTYVLTYTVSDEWGNVASKDRFVTVKRIPLSADEAAAKAVITPVTAETANAGSKAGSASGNASGAASGSASGAASGSAAGTGSKAAAKPAKADPDKIIYLTFDDGPGRYTEELLKILDDHKVHATFFVTLANDEYRDLIKKEYESGHSVAVHTATHEYSQIYESAEAYWDDFNKVQEVIQELTGCRTDLFRFPGGSSNTISANYCEGIMTKLAQESADKGYIYVDWNVTSGDAGDTTDGEVMYENMMNGIHTYKNSFILCHDIKEYTVKMMDKFITDALKEGYTFLPITAESPSCKHGINN